MSEDEFKITGEELKFIEDCDVVKQTLKTLTKDHTIIEATGLIMGVIALHFKAYGYTHDDFCDFLYEIAETGWPEDPKPNLKLVKK